MTKRRKKAKPKGRRKIVTPGGCMIWVDADARVTAAGEQAPAKSVAPKPGTFKPDATAELTADERLAIEIAAARPPFSADVSAKLIDSSALPPELFLETVAKVKGTPLDGLSEYELRMLQVRLKLVRERRIGELTPRQRKEWGFSDLEALKMAAEFERTREAYAK